MRRTNVTDLFCSIGVSQSSTWRIAGKWAKDGNRVVGQVDERQQHDERNEAERES